MSTGKIGRTLNPRSKVTPGYTVQTEQKIQTNSEVLVDKVDEALVIIKDDIRPLLECIQKQNDLIEKVLLKLSVYENKLDKLEFSNKNLSNRFKDIETKLQTTTTALEELSKKIDEHKTEKKGWFA